MEIKKNITLKSIDLSRYGKFKKKSPFWLTFTNTWPVFLHMYFTNILFVEFLN